MAMIIKSQLLISISPKKSIFFPWLFPGSPSVLLNVSVWTPPSLRHFVSYLFLSMTQQLFTPINGKTCLYSVCEQLFSGANGAIFRTIADSSKKDQANTKSYAAGTLTTLCRSADCAHLAYTSIWVDFFRRAQDFVELGLHKQKNIPVRVHFQIWRVSGCSVYTTGFCCWFCCWPLCICECIPAAKFQNKPQLFDRCFEFWLSKKSRFFPCVFRCRALVPWAIARILHVALIQTFFSLRPTKN